MAEFIAHAGSRSQDIGERPLFKPSRPVARPTVAGAKLSPQKSIELFANFVDFIKVLSAPEICFLMIVITKTEYGRVEDVPIPRTDIIQHQAIPSLAVKQIREKLVDMGLISVTQKRIGRGSEAWHYSLCCSKLSSLFIFKEGRAV